LRAASDHAWPTRRPGSLSLAQIVIDEEGIVRHRHDHLLGFDDQSWTTSSGR
jgi:hypothetical protein